MDIDDLIVFQSGGHPICVQTSTTPGASLLYRSEIVMATAQFVDASSVSAAANGGMMMNNNCAETPYFREDEEDTKVMVFTPTADETAGTAMPPVPTNSSFDSSQFTGLHGSST